MLEKRKEVRNVGDERNRSFSKARMRNLKQYKSMSDEEFEEVYSDYMREQETDFDRIFQSRVDEEYKKFEEDFDLSDLKANDLITLREFLTTAVQLEFINKDINLMLRDGITEQNSNAYNQLNRTKSDLISNLTRLQDILNITRKNRTSNKDSDTVTFIENLVVKAQEFYKQKMDWVFCPKCNTLLATIWWLYPEEKENEIILKCNRRYNDGNLCDGEVHLTSKWLLENGKTNNKEIPDRLK